MGKRGPKTQPVALAKIKDTYRPVRYGKDHESIGIEFIAEPPPFPPSLGSFGREIWDAVCRQAIKVGNWISVTDLPALEQYCKAAEIARAYSNGDPIEEDAKGNRRQSAEFKVWRDSVMLMDRLSSKFGLDPSSKASMKFGMKNEPKVEDFTEWSL